MERTFFDCHKFNNDGLSGWNTSNVTSMSGLFEDARIFDGNISNWDVSKVKLMTLLFRYNYKFNQDISGWNVSAVTNMRLMFQNASLFNQYISGWDTSSIITGNFTNMFSGANAMATQYGASGETPMDGYGVSPTSEFFNNELTPTDETDVTNSVKYYFGDPDADDTSFSDKKRKIIKARGSMKRWKLSNITNMKDMFKGRTGFNEDLSKWDVSNVTDMSNMFDGATDFDSDVSDWDVSKASTMANMFKGGTNFTKNISHWKPPPNCDLTDMFKDSGMEAYTYIDGYNNGNPI